MEKNVELGEQYATWAWISLAVGIFLLAIVAGPVAIHFSNKAEKYGVDASTQRTLGWVELGLGILAILLI